MLSTGLFETYNFLQDEGLLKWWDLPTNKFGKVSAKTNTRLVNAIEKLFQEHGHSELVEKSDSLKEITIDLQGFKQLDENDELINYLRTVTDRARVLTVRKRNWALVTA